MYTRIEEICLNYVAILSNTNQTISNLRNITYNDSAVCLVLYVLLLFNNSSTLMYYSPLLLPYALIVLSILNFDH